MPAGIWALGVGSLLMDTSSELIHSLLPIYMATVLGTSMAVIGLVEGVAEGAAAVTKVFSGALSDWWGKRKPLMLLGYGLSAATKPIFPLATTVGWVFAARFVDRVGKGVRGAPRDALVAEIAPAELRGAAYGLRQGLDSVGACLGPLLAIGLMALLGERLHAAMWVAVVPATMAVTLLAIYVREPEESAPERRRSHYLTGVRGLPRRFWLVVGVGAVFTLARFSEAFLVLRARDVGVGLAMVPAVMVAMNVVYAAFSHPAGALADRMSARVLLVWGLVVLVAADGALAVAEPWGPVMAGSVLWGLHMALTQGLMAKLVADSVGAEVRGTAFGVFNLVSGGALLLASVIAGALWETWGAPATFAAGGAFAAVAAAGLTAYGWVPGRNKSK